MKSAKRFNVNVDARILKKFKLLAVRSSKSMSEIVREFIESVVI